MQTRDDEYVVRKTLGLGAAKEDGRNMKEAYGYTTGWHEADSVEDAEDNVW